MDKQFMEFWGNACLSAVRGQQQLEDMTKWFTGAFTGTQNLNQMFSKIYGLDALPKEIPDYFSWWEKSMNEFQKSFLDFFAMMDLVPRKAYQELEKENEELKLKISELEKNITPLHSIVEEEIKLAKEGAKGFQVLIEEQARQYQELMNTVGKAFTATPASTQEQGMPQEQEEPTPSRKKSTKRSSKTEK
jgi:hypothetical protein